MLELVTTGAFRKDLKLAKKRGYDLSLLETVLNTLLEEKTLDQRYHDHALTGNYIGFRECHILPDWLLIYAVNKSQLILTTSDRDTLYNPHHDKQMLFSILTEILSITLIMINKCFNI